MNTMRLTLLTLFALLISACASYSTYTVRPGDSLSVIAIRHNITVAELSRLNNISNPNHIRPGQQLKVKGASSAAKVRSSSSYSNSNVSNSTSSRSSSTNKGTATKASNHSIQASNNYTNQPIPKMAGWHKPTQGKVVRSFNPNLPGHKGIQIAGNLNQAVNSANSGEVVYAGQGSGGAGQLIIIKHSNTVYTAYGYLSSISVKEGQRVNGNQMIGAMGKSSDGRTVLHFEVRVDGAPINPTRYVTF